MKEMCYICLYLSYTQAFMLLTDEEAGMLVKGILNYSQTGEEPDLPRICEPLWVFLKDQHDRDRKRYDERCKVNRQNGKKGGRPRKQTVS